jgi:hypothetical protein
MYALTTHCIVARELCRASRITGSATFTTELSMKVSADPRIVAGSTQCVAAGAISGRP